MVIMGVLWLIALALPEDRRQFIERITEHAMTALSPMWKSRAHRAALDRGDQRPD